MPSILMDALDLLIDYIASAGVMAVLFYDLPCHALMWLLTLLTAFFASEACCLFGAILGALILGFAGVAIVIESRNIK